MDKIVRLHEKILDHLLKLRKIEQNLYFVPRKINNQQRLDKGYWFIGNEYYLNLSFWNGMDWKEKIHNIGFVVLDDKHTYIELSAQDSDSKTAFLNELAQNIGGFHKDSSKNKWFKFYPQRDIIKNLDNFIKEIKPQIDALIIKRRPTGITLVDIDFYNKYSDKIKSLREKQILYGVKNKLTRICWNTENWKFPSGSSGKSISAETYEAKQGYGHEEWLLDKSKLINSYHYAFLQPLFIKSNKHVNKIYNINLFTINNLSKKYFVGIIKNVECISKDESKRIYDFYKTKGWLGNMKKDIERVNADHKQFMSTSPQDFFNIRFKFGDLKQPDELIEISDFDSNITTNHYKLLPQKSEILFAATSENPEDEKEGNKKSTSKRKKVFNSECEYDPYHDKIQNALYELLKKRDKNQYKKVYIEKGRVDVKAKTINDTWHYFEVKTDNPKLSIRKGLGQILEYSCYPDTNKAEKLIIVADEAPNKDVTDYLKHLRSNFNIPLTYRYFNLDENDLSDDY
jgi:hypothetical protein